jgi:uncharacterized membrane protein
MAEVYFIAALIFGGPAAVVVSLIVIGINDIAAYRAEKARS